MKDMLTMLNQSGKIFYKDEYDTIYSVEWLTDNNEVIDITSITMQPYVWCEQNIGYVKNNILYRYGIITAFRQRLKLVNGNYNVISEGITQYKDYIQMNYPCTFGPVDNFKYHLDCYTDNIVESRVITGPRWADPDDPNDVDAIWNDIDSNGDPVSIVTEGTEAIAWIDVWGD